MIRFKNPTTAVLAAGLKLHGNWSVYLKTVMPDVGAC
jgi:hypothetical protein